MSDLSNLAITACQVHLAATSSVSTSHNLTVPSSLPLATVLPFADSAIPTPPVETQVGPPPAASAGYFWRLQLDVDFDRTDSFADDAEEEFVPQASKSDLDVPSSLPTLLSLSSLPKLSSTSIFTPYTFWLSRETSRSIFEFLVRSFGGRIGWPASSGGGSAPVM